MDAETVDREYADLQQKGQQTAALVQALAGKLSSAATSGDTNAREWQRDRKEIALAIRDEESTATSLLRMLEIVGGWSTGAAYRRLMISLIIVILRRYE